MCGLVGFLCEIVILVHRCEQVKEYVIYSVTGKCLSPKNNLLNFNTHFSGKEYIIKYSFLAVYKGKTKMFKMPLTPLRLWLNSP